MLHSRWKKMMKIKMIATMLGLILMLGVTMTVNGDSLAMFPRPTMTRQPISLDGVWNFRITHYSMRDDIGFKHHWYNRSLDSIDGDFERMPVPASFNDITEKREIRDFVGWSWYDRVFLLPPNFDSKNTAALLRFGSVNYEAVVWLNGKHVMNHTGGHLPFQADVTKFLNLAEPNHLTVAVNNNLTAETLPQGKIAVKNDSRRKGVKFVEFWPQFDFFNYAGIQRSVYLYLVPNQRITDINITTAIDGNDGYIQYNVITNDNGVNRLQVECFDRDGKMVAKSSELNDNLKVENAKLWWPYTMNPEPGYQYKLRFRMVNHDRLIDEYVQMVGIRRLDVDQETHQFLVNDKPFYFRGFGKHEEYDIRGRSQDQVMIMKDFNLIKWMGANSFRTSHYPYSEQLMDEADQQGIVVIDECPAVGLSSFNKILLKQHLQAITEMIERDKNRPSVFMWSIANEAQSNHKEAKEYFEAVASHARDSDPWQRPITAASNQYFVDHLPAVCDVVMLNRYYGWYRDSGYPQAIQDSIVGDFMENFELHGKPVMISEYGAEAIPGLNHEPSVMFSEDFHAETMIENHKAFDKLRKLGYFIGEHIWNFADFQTHQTTTRVGGNKKGIFTRQRQPKPSARILRCRYWQLANITYHDEHRQGFSYCPMIQYS